MSVPHTAPPQQPVGAPTSIPTPGAAASRNRRRPMLVLAAVLLLLVSALSGAYAFSQLTTTTAVVGLADTVHAGEAITRDKLTIIQVLPAAGLETVPATDIDSVVGKRAVTDLPKGTTLTPSSVTEALVPTTGKAIVGITATAGSAPARGLDPGAAVLLVPLPTDSTTEQGAEPVGDPIPGRIIQVNVSSDGSSQQVDVEVDASEAAAIQRLAADDRVGIIIVSKER